MKTHPNEVKTLTEEEYVSLLVEAEQLGPAYVAALQEQLARLHIIGE